MLQQKSETFFIDNMIFMASCPDKCFDLAVVDPPYGINATKMQMGSHPTRKGDNEYPSTSTAVKIRKGRLNQGGGKLKNRILNTSTSNWDNVKPTPEYFKELFRISKNQIIWGGNYFDLPPTRCIIVWDKCQPWDNFSQVEMAWTSFDKPAKLYRISNTGGANSEKKIHETQKPIKLYDNIFRDFASEGITCIDTHLGSGSSRISAYKANIIFTGLENDEIHFNDEELRFAKFISKYQKQFRLPVPIGIQQLLFP